MPPPTTNSTTPACLALVLFLLTATLGCSFTGGPRARFGYLPTNSFWTPYPDPDTLKSHSYGFSLSESSGMLYTCRGGHIDLDHIRGNADTTRYLAKKISKTLSNNDPGFTFSLPGEWSTHRVRFTYPPDWNSQRQKQPIIDEVSLSLAPYLAFDASLWHEILTWFGVHFALIEPEFDSAFSWEDLYSNLLGTKIAVEALRQPDLNYDLAMTLALQRQLEQLRVQPRSVALHASDRVRGYWYTTGLSTTIIMRNFDIGLDGFITPSLVPGLANCADSPLLLPVPNLTTLKKYGFSITYQIKPNVWEQGRIFKAAGSNEIFPEKHFPILIDYIKKDAAGRGYKYYE